MPKRFTLQLDSRDVFQLLDGLELRAQSWERTAEYLRSGYVEDDYLVEECHKPEEADDIAAHYRAIIESIRKQVETQQWSVGRDSVEPRLCFALSKSVVSRMGVQLKKLSFWGTLMSNAGNRVDPVSHAEKMRDEWRQLFRVWWFFHYTLGIAAGLSAVGLTIVSQPVSDGSHSNLATLGFGALSVTCSTLVTFLGPLQRADRFSRAFHVLDQAVIEYSTSLISLKAFTQRIQDAREIVLNGTATAKHTAETNDPGADTRKG
jgi:hypothetical protein